MKIFKKRTLIRLRKEAIETIEIRYRYLDDLSYSIDGCDRIHYYGELRNRINESTINKIKGIKTLKKVMIDFNYRAVIVENAFVKALQI